ncbi:MAG: glycine--tRNA ligase subunit beta [Elusimicrobia bacterium]|nr:glycine--tRNA ligase subunit beta [Elusimicrobiota bacterium]
MSRDILLEIGCEEIPAGYLPAAIEQIKAVSEQELKTARLEFREINVCATLRRLVLYVEDISEQQKILKTEISGPSESAAFSEGKPTPAAIGFAKKYGVEVSNLVVKNGKVCAIKNELALKTEEVLPAILKKIISSLTFPKTMKWESSGFRFVRPVRWVLALYGKKVIKFQIADVKSSNITYIRYYKKVKITEPKKYVDILRNKSVIVEQNLRLEMLKKAVFSQVKNKGEILESNEILGTVNNLIEFPSAILCKFDEQFLKLPKEIIANTLKRQKNFVVVDNNKTKNIISFFIGVKDGISTNVETIREGYEKVVTARLEDAEFYFKNDTKTKLEEKVEKLKGIIFQEKLGTIYDKTQRIKKLSMWLNNNTSTHQHVNTSTLERLCLLCKADLATETVSEFPELQGIFGSICAIQDKEDELVAEGIEQHWWPILYDGKIPVSSEASIVSVADKIDTLVSNIAIGIIPTGSADPHGLRRTAVGIIRIAIEKELSFSLSEITSQAIENMLIDDKPLKFENNEKIILQVKDFLKQRLSTYFSNKDIKNDEIDAVLSVKFDDIYDSYNRVVAVHSIRTLPDFEPIATSFKRIGNILKQARISEKGYEKSEVREELLKENEEKTLYKVFLDIKSEIDKAIGINDYKTVLQYLVSLRKPVDSFFEKILIMDKDEEVKNNRLLLLSAIYNQFIQIADFSKLVPTEIKELKK